MEPATTIIRHFGGHSALAKILGVHRTTVWKWAQPKQRGGTDGAIPVAHWPAILSEAKRLKITLKMGDLLRWDASPSRARARGAPGSRLSRGETRPDWEPAAKIEQETSGAVTASDFMPEACPAPSHPVEAA